MTDAVAADFRAIMADRIEAAHQMLASRWPEQLKPLIPVAPNDIFPGNQILGQVPALIVQLAAFFRAPAEEAIAANAVVTGKASGDQTLSARATRIHPSGSSRIPTAPCGDCAVHRRGGLAAASDAERRRGVPPRGATEFGD